MKTIIYAHPYEGSFNHAILMQLVTTFTDHQQPFQVIDLCKDGFNPAFTKVELGLYSKGASLDPLVAKYQTVIKASDELIFIFPIWWFNVPAIIKGFLDKVMLNGFAFKDEPRSDWEGLLTYIQKIRVITTSTLTKDYLERESGNPIQAVLINRVFDDLGLDPQKTKWIHFGKVDITTDEARHAFLHDLPSLI